MKTLLIISPTFFPDPMVASVRMVQWCRWLPEFGWKPVVYCRHYGFEATREELDRAVHPEVEVHHLNAAPARDVGRTTRRVLPGLFKIAADLCVPDSSIRFWNGATPNLINAVREHRPAVVLSTVPPYGVHSAGLTVSRATNVPWVADWREAFIADRRYRPRGLRQARWRALRAFEDSVYRRASLVIHQLPVHERWARRRYPFARSKCVTMINGFGDELLGEREIGEQQVPRARTISIIGTSSDESRLRLAIAVADVRASGLDVQLRIIGRTPGNLDKLQERLGEHVVATGYLPHSEAIREIINADVLVNYLSPERQTGMIISTKLIEYIASRRPIVQVNPTKSDIRFARGWDQVVSASEDAPGELADALRKALRMDGAPAAARFDQYRQDFGWRSQVQRVSAWLDALA